MYYGVILPLHLFFMWSLADRAKSLCDLGGEGEESWVYVVSLRYSRFLMIQVGMGYWLDMVSADKDSVSDLGGLFSQLRQG